MGKITYTPTHRINSLLAVGYIEKSKLKTLANIPPYGIIYLITIMNIIKELKR